jgi:hypothetical protein
MRPEDLARLKEPYPENVEPTDAEARAAIGLNLPRWTVLEDEIFADFTEQPRYGIGWWAPYPGTGRRILISDQLYCCLASVAGNMAEAALHWLEYLGAADRDSARLADAVKMTLSGPVISPPRPRNPFEQLCPEFIRIHQAGMIRALASALDCLAGVIIGVTALPMSILRADFDKARAKLAKINGALNVGTNMQAQFAAQLEAGISAAGSQGWLDWTLDFRNMLVHRGRRIELGQYLPITPVLRGADGQPVPRARRVAHLPRDPDRSDVEVFLGMPWNTVLHEEAQQTLQGLMNSATQLVETMATHLIKLWRWRRGHPADLRQPAEQWKDGPSTRSTGFNGCAPSSLSLSPSMGMMHPVTARRFHAAALNDQARPEWATFT